NYNDSEYEKFFDKLLGEIGPDMVHIQHLMYASLGIVNIIKKNKIPIVFTLHDLWLECLRITKLDHSNKVCEGWGEKKCLDCYNSNHLNIKNKYLLKVVNSLNTILQGTVIHKFALFLIGKRKIFLRNVPGDKKNPARDRFEKMMKMVEKVDLFISPSDFLRKEFVKWGIGEEKIIYSRNGMNILKNEDGIKNKFIKKEDGILDFVFTSQVREHKGVDVLLEAFEILEKKKIKQIKDFEQVHMLDATSIENMRFIPDSYCNSSMIINSNDGVAMVHGKILHNAVYDKMIALDCVAAYLGATLSGTDDGAAALKTGEQTVLFDSDILTQKGGRLYIDQDVFVEKYGLFVTQYKETKIIDRAGIWTPFQCSILNATVDTFMK
ncbi:MAG: hypothetical protein EOM23_04865, partial [Candidatus Moranbacteria bacterium]|nr:hypothetical protein [Candidatus Moranbacteria bacterium]